MKLGAFSVSLAVKDLEKSRDFYRSLGFEVCGGDFESNYLMMKNDTSLIGLFQGMFDRNILTFNPGWDADSNSLEGFDDVRQIQRTLKDRGIEIEVETDQDSSGPASFVVTDPDGNTILVDQHVDKP